MIEKFAVDLTQQYISGWKSNNLAMIISCLAENCIVIESHGPTYHGISEIELWFKFWMEANSKVHKWDILSFCFSEKNETAYLEWDFACISKEIEYALQGLSIIKYTENKIAFIHEYRMTHPAYRWKREQLNSA
ncbi:MAG: nuclear transport factor 2 family protein [Legionellales bacterium]|nr:nuclear transport factor 2 family protein [Legionellales bacterium]